MMMMKMIVLSIKGKSRSGISMYFLVSIAKVI